MATHKMQIDVLNLNLRLNKKQSQICNKCSREGTEKLKRLLNYRIQVRIQNILIFNPSIYKQSYIRSDLYNYFTCFLTPGFSFLMVFAKRRLLIVLGAMGILALGEVHTPSPQQFFDSEFYIFQAIPESILTLLFSFPH